MSIITNLKKKLARLPLTIFGRAEKVKPEPLTPRPEPIPVPKPIKPAEEEK